MLDLRLKIIESVVVGTLYNKEHFIQSALTKYEYTILHFFVKSLFKISFQFTNG